MNLDNRSLCLCLTPLHVLIARRIAEARGLRFSTGLYLTSADNQKQRHYANAMRGFCDDVEYRVVPGESDYRGQKHVAIWKRRFGHRREFRRFGGVHAVYVPSSLNHDVYALLSAIGFESLFTFDDGLINIDKASPLARWRTRPAAKAFLLSAGITYWPERIRAEAVRHFSIYRMENLCPRTEFLELVAGPAAGNTREEGIAPLRIMLGSAPEAGEKTWNALQAAVDRLKPDVYLPHPRETVHKLVGVAYLDTDLVAEDYVLSELQRLPSRGIELYGCETSALLNLAHTPGVKTFSISAEPRNRSGLDDLFAAAGILPIACRDGTAD